MSQAGLNNVAGSLPSTVVETLTGNSGGAVGPDGSHNINVIGSGTISVAGNPGTNTLTITSSGTGLMWSTISASQTLAVNHGYICISPGGALSLLLPAVSALGDIIEITLDGATSFTVTQGAAQSVRYGNQSTTAGVGGSLATTQQGDTLRLVCQTANLKWNVLSSMGNLTVV
jgi:hypothetical protein